MPVSYAVPYSGARIRARIEMPPIREAGSYTFTLILDGRDPLNQEQLDALFAAGCGDATFGRRGSIGYADFDRVAPSFARAVASAITAIEGTVPGLHVVRIEPEDLVSAADIAGRTGRSRESVRLLIAGQRGPGHFPAPTAWLNRRRPLWRWSDVAQWYATALGEPVELSKEAAFVAALNAALELRRQVPHLAEREAKELVVRVIQEDAALLRGVA
jgi:hypothetical protein